MNEFLTPINPSPSAKNASASSSPSENSTIAESTESSGDEIERADVPQATTDITEATLPQITLLDQKTVPTGTISIGNKRLDCTFLFIDFVCLLYLLNFVL
jgi:hypothetical protein